MQQALVDRLTDQLAKHTIVSHFDGYVTTQHAEVGDWVTKGDPVLEVIALDTVEVKVNVPEKYIDFVRLGEHVQVQVAALTDPNFPGQVAMIIPEADLRARTFPVRIRVQNRPHGSGPLLKAGMMARAMLPTGSRSKAMLVSKDALVLGGERPVVFVVDFDTQDGRAGKVRHVGVQLGVAVGNRIQVDGPLKPGQRVVVRGNERLRPGQEVAVASDG
jgi:RND family efflux transporter MFP subunit